VFEDRRFATVLNQVPNGSIFQILPLAETLLPYALEDTLGNFW
jgi:hypothetical protein